MTKVPDNPADFDYSRTGPLAPLYPRLAEGFADYMIAPPPGWVDIVLELDEQLSQILPDYTIAQVKEKFATLRYYIGSYGDDSTEALRDEANRLILLAERRSAITCQDCGRAGKPRTDLSWMATLCEDHYERDIHDKLKDR